MSTRTIFWMVAVVAVAGVGLMLRPAWQKQSDPFFTLSKADADAVHRALWDRSEASRQRL